MRRSDVCLTHSQSRLLKLALSCQVWFLHYNFITTLIKYVNFLFLKSETINASWNAFKRLFKCTKWVPAQKLGSKFLFKFCWQPCSLSSSRFPFRDDVNFLLPIEKKHVSAIKDFNTKVIDMFCIEKGNIYAYIAVTHNLWTPQAASD